MQTINKSACFENLEVSSGTIVDSVSLISSKEVVCQVASDDGCTKMIAFLKWTTSLRSLEKKKTDDTQGAWYLHGDISSNIILESFKRNVTRVVRHLLLDGGATSEAPHGGQQQVTYVKPCPSPCQGETEAR